MLALGTYHTIRHPDTYLHLSEVKHMMVKCLTSKQCPGSSSSKNNSSSSNTNSHSNLISCSLQQPPYGDTAVQQPIYEYCFTSLSAQSWPELLFQMTSRVLYSAQYHRQHCTLQAFEQFGALYMQNHNDKYPARQGFEPGTSRLQALVDTDEPSGPARSTTCCKVVSNI